MKKLIGKDIGNYVFDASARTITIAGVTLTQEQLLLITNTTDGVILYNFADSAAGGVLADNVLTLAYDTTAMSDADAIQIYADIPEAAEPEVSESKLARLMRVLLNTVMYPPWLDRRSNQLRAVLGTGDGGAASNIGTVATVTTCSTVTTCNTVSALTNLNAYNANQLVQQQNAAAWAATCRARIS